MQPNPREPMLDESINSDGLNFRETRPVKKVALLLYERSLDLIYFPNITKPRAEMKLAC